MMVVDVVRKGWEQGVKSLGQPPRKQAGGPEHGPGARWACKVPLSHPGPRAEQPVQSHPSCLQHPRLPGLGSRHRVTRLRSCTRRRPHWRRPHYPLGPREPATRASSPGCTIAAEPRP